MLTEPTTAGRPAWEIGKQAAGRITTQAAQNRSALAWACYEALERRAEAGYPG